MKRCPTCHKTFTDRNLTFCIDDGTPLLPVADAADSPADEATVVRPSSGSDSGSSPSSHAHGAESERVPVYEPPGTYVPPGLAGQPGKRRTWPWILGLLVIVLVIFGGLGIAAVMLVPNMIRGSANANTANLNANAAQRNSDPNPGNSNSTGDTNSVYRNENGNDNLAADDTTPPPANEQEVLSDLTDLEHDWTVANINADKKKLDRILADDYVGTLPDGKQQGKAEYLRTATRDTAIQKWNFEDLKVSLRGDRATLTGILQVEIKDERGQDQSVAFSFTDKFVWRDGRWQATGSEVNLLKPQGTAA